MADDPWADFASWAPHASDSPLYHRLANDIADDEELSHLAGRIENPARQNILLAAVHFLLEKDDPLSAFYASYTEAPAPPEDAYPHFRLFALEHAAEILEIGRTRFTQTNEVRRLGVLLPYLMAEADRLGEPVHLIEVGASAGLNLCLDRYAYDYGGVRFGQSDLVVETEPEGEVPVPVRAPYVQRRVGIDLHPVDINDLDQVRWLEALVWPEQLERRRRLRQAIRIRRTVQMDMVRGDASRVIGSVLDGLPTAGPAIVFHAFTWNQLDADARRRFDAAMARAASRRSVSRIGFEFWDPGDAHATVRLGITSDEMRPVAEAHHHGAWVRAI